MTDIQLDQLLWSAADIQGFLADASVAGAIPGTIDHFEFNTGFVVAVVKQPGKMPMARFSLDMTRPPFRVVRLLAPLELAT